MIPAPFVYNATVVRVIDGDSIWCEVDRGMYDFSHWNVRLLGCNARELNMPGGQEAFANLAELLPVGTPLVLTTAKPDKFGGRVDADVTFDLDGEDTSLAPYLIAAGWAAPWDGRGLQPVPDWPRA